MNALAAQAGASMSPSRYSTRTEILQARTCGSWCATSGREDSRKVRACGGVCGVLAYFAPEQRIKSTTAFCINS